MHWLTQWLIPEWRKAHRLWSTQIQAVTIVLGVLWLLVPALQTLIDTRIYIETCIALAVLTLIVRLLKQEKLHHES